MIDYLTLILIGKLMPSFRASSSQELSYLIIGAVHAQTAQLCPALPSFSGGRGDVRKARPHLKVGTHLHVGGVGGGSDPAPRAAKTILLH